eukprot:symbB.v1.2.019787.t3/scaffold1604.1/size109659/1
MNARGEPSPIVHGWSEMNMAVDLTPELNLADLTNFAKDQWAFAFDQKGNEFSNKSYAVATVEKDLPKAFSVVLHDTLERAKHREFEPKRQQWLQKSSSQKGTGWEGYKGIGQGKGKGHSGKGSYQKQTKGTGHWGSNQPYWQQSQNDQYYWNQRHQQYQRSYPGGSAGKGYGGSSSSSHGGYHSKGRSERPREEAVEWHGAMYTKYTYSDGRVVAFRPPTEVRRPSLQLPEQSIRSIGGSYRTSSRGSVKSQDGTSSINSATHLQGAKPKRKISIVQPA